MCPGVNAALDPAVADVYDILADCSKVYRTGGSKGTTAKNELVRTVEHVLTVDDRIQ